jgi:hypothetical protein
MTREILKPHVGKSLKEREGLPKETAMARLFGWAQHPVLYYTVPYCTWYIPTVE